MEKKSINLKIIIQKNNYLDIGKYIYIIFFFLQIIEWNIEYINIIMINLELLDNVINITKNRLIFQNFKINLFEYIDLL